MGYMRSYIVCKPDWDKRLQILTQRRGGAEIWTKKGNQAVSAWFMKAQMFFSLPFRASMLKFAAAYPFQNYTTLSTLPQGLMRRQPFQ